MAAKHTDTDSNGKPQNEEPNQEHKPTCGIIMPIGAIGGLQKEHWADVKRILSNIIEKAGFVPNLVSDGSNVGVIQNRIINNLYNNDIVVCDVSEKNPNVMFELGLRLVFDKPTIIIKDDITTYSFDTSPIEHLDYPRDLRYNLIEEFQENLTFKLKATYKKAKSDPNYTTFLGHFGNYKPSKVEDKEAPAFEIIMRQLQLIQSEVAQLKPTKRLATAPDPMHSFTQRLPKIDPFLYLKSIIRKELSNFLSVSRSSLEDFNSDSLDSFIKYLKGNTELKNTPTIGPIVFDRIVRDVVNQSLDAELF